MCGYKELKAGALLAPDHCVHCVSRDVPVVGSSSYDTEFAALTQNEVMRSVLVS